jgi:hypothetical protein
VKGKVIYYGWACGNATITLSVSESDIRGSKIDFTHEVEINPAKKNRKRKKTRKN